MSDSSVMSAQDKPSGAKVWVTASRPATLLACVVPVMVGSAMAAATGSFRWDVVLVALASAGMIQIGTNLYNDYADFERGTHAWCGSRQCVRWQGHLLQMPDHAFLW